MASPESVPTRAAIRAAIMASGETDEAYLDFHLERFWTTWKLVEESLQGESVRLLDIGAHWLHQAVVFAANGHSVTATDIASTLRRPSVQRLAEQWGIRCAINENLEAPEAGWAELADASFDVVLLAEVVEHLAFNPRLLWREIERVLVPGGLVVITTPNAYALRRLARTGWRFLRGLGDGVSVESILSDPTHSHHWKEYSARELECFLRLLDGPFEITRSLKLVNCYPGQSRLTGMVDHVEALFPPFRSHLHVEARLRGRRS